jgi:hypothetical protein
VGGERKIKNVGKKKKETDDLVAKRVIFPLFYFIYFYGFHPPLSLFLDEHEASRAHTQ